MQRIVMIVVNHQCDCEKPDFRLQSSDIQTTVGLAEASPRCIFSIQKRQFYYSFDKQNTLRYVKQRRVFFEKDTI
jgi:hypothetical protein